MALTASLGHSAFLQLSTSFYGDTSPSSSISTTFPGNQSFSRKQFVVFARKMSGLDEARRIKRERELQVVKKDRKGPPLRRGKVSPRLPVPDDILKPPYVGSDILPEIGTEYQIHDSEGIAKMRAAGELAARVLNFAGTLVRPSVTTNEIDKAVHQMIIDAGAYPSPLGYGGFPKSVCTSVNECMCHGIPDSRQLQNGDIINIDVTVYLNGYHGDTSKTFFCGDVSDAIKNLVKVTEECLEKGIAVCKDGTPFKKIGKRISEHAEKYGYGVVERFVGHGVGTVFHCVPYIYHHRNDEGGCMVEGQTFTIEHLELSVSDEPAHNLVFQFDSSFLKSIQGYTRILYVHARRFLCVGQAGGSVLKLNDDPVKFCTAEPILSMGSTDCITWPDNWTTVTTDGSPAAQFEHTILITRTGAEILTTC